MHNRSNAGGKDDDMLTKPQFGIHYDTLIIELN